jgi:hypothetical protein
MSSIAKSGGRQRTKLSQAIADEVDPAGSTPLAPTSRTKRSAPPLCLDYRVGTPPMGISEAPAALLLGGEGDPLRGMTMLPATVRSQREPRYGGPPAEAVEA